MKSNSLLISFVIAVLLLATAPQLRAQSTTRQQNNALARGLFLEGVNFFDEGKFVDAEKKFREAVTKYPDAEGSDRTSFYLLSALIKLGRTGEARSEILNFNQTYPQSKWKADVEEKRLHLDGAQSR
jgi:TolA-binding protein